MELARGGQEKSERTWHARAMARPRPARTTTGGRYRLALGRTLEAFLVCVALLHVAAAPYTKVEESFSLQAIHDILAFGLRPAARDKVRG